MVSGKVGLRKFFFLPYFSFSRCFTRFLAYKKNIFFCLEKVEKLDLENVQLFSEIFFLPLFFHFLAVSDDFSPTKKIKKFYMAKVEKLDLENFQLFSEIFFLPLFFIFSLFQTISRLQKKIFFFAWKKSKSWT